MTISLSSKLKPLFDPAGPRWRLILALILAVVLAWLFIELVRFSLGAVSDVLWRLLAAAALIGVAGWWFMRGAASAGRGRAQAALPGELGAADPALEAVPSERLGGSIESACVQLGSTPTSDLYRVPWLLVVGPDASANDAFLRAVGKAAQTQAPSPLETQPQTWWQWWSARRTVLVEMKADVVCGPEARTPRRLWHRALFLLREHRPLMPLNGIVLVLPWAVVSASESQAAEAGIRLRRLVDEATRHLDVDLPVYLVMPGVEGADGAGLFLDAIPDHWRAGPLGQRFALNAEGTLKAGLPEVAGALRNVAAQTRAAVVALLETELPLPSRGGIYAFGSAMARCEAGVMSVARALVAPAPGQYVPRIGGIYFVATGERGAFIETLMERLLPADQPAAKRGRGNLQRTLLGTFTGLLLVVAASLGVGHAAAELMQANRQAEAAVAGACGESASGQVTLAWGVQCGRALAKIESTDTRLGASLKFVFARGHERLAERLAASVSLGVLAPHDRHVDQLLATGKVDVQSVFAVSQRLSLLDRCRVASADCEDQILASLKLGIGKALRSVGVDARRTVASDDDLVFALAGQARWLNSAAHEAEANRLRGLLAQMVRRGLPMTADLRRWGESLQPAYALGDFWSSPAAGTRAAEQGDQLSIAVTYSAPVWLHAVRTLHSQASALGDGERVLADKFFAEYRRDYFEAWALFLGRFQRDGVRYWRGSSDGMLQAAIEQQPYDKLNRVITVHLYDLPVVLPWRTRASAAMAQVHDAPMSAPSAVWRQARLASTASLYGSAPAPLWLVALHESRNNVSAQVKTRVHAAILKLKGDKGYVEAYEVASELFKTKGQATIPIARDWVEALAATSSAPEPSAPKMTAQDIEAWSIVRGPVQLLLHVTVTRAAEFIQRRWSDSVILPLSKLPPEERVARLGGPQGRLTSFRAEYLKPFVSETDGQPVALVGSSLPLSIAFQALISQGNSSSLAAADQAVSVGTFQFTHPSSVGSLPEGAGGSTLEIDCRDRQWVVRSNAETASEARVMVQWSAALCPEARLRVSLPDRDRSSPQNGELVRLTRVYSGREGFQTLVQDFKDGSRTFAVSDFRRFYTPEQWQALDGRLKLMGAESVRIHLSVSPTAEFADYLSSRKTADQIPTNILSL